MTNSARLLKITHFFRFWCYTAVQCSYLRRIVCQIHMLSSYAVFLWWWSWRYYSCTAISHTLHFWIDISFLENCNVNAIRTWLFWFLCQNTTLEFLANPRIFLLVHTTAATAACPIIEFFFSCPPIITIESQMNIKNVSLSLHFFSYEQS